jgi:phenylalanyl-tRNA synthetase beta chain
MLETGQPLHAFDYHLIAKGKDGKPTIVVRRAAAGEKFTTLDGQPRALTNEMLLIADEQKGIALAGVMGGQNTEIQESTKDVLIESACFAAASVRRTSRALGLRTDASYRFERGSDPNFGASYASERAAALILELAGGTAAEGVVDAYPKVIEQREITLRHRKVNELLGIDLSPHKMEYYLSQLGLKAASRKARPLDADGPIEPITLRVPTFRVDLKRETDLIEEIARLHGMDNIPATTPRAASGSNEFDAVFDQLASVRRILTGLGLDEAQDQTLISKSHATMNGVEPAMLANPLSSDMDAMRPSLLPGLLASVQHNASRQNLDIALFEIGRVFHRQNGAPKEERRLAMALTGRRNSAFWTGDDREARFDLFDLKGLLEEFFERLGLRGITFGRRNEIVAPYLESAALMLGKNQLGEFGQLQPAIARKLDLRDAVLLAELNLELAMSIARRSAGPRTFKPLPAYPAIRRDVAMLVPEATTHEAVLGAVKSAKPANLESAELFDVFRGKNVPEGQKSLAYAFVYRSAERTLTDAEVNAAHEKLVAQLKTSVQASIREN